MGKLWLSPLTGFYQTYEDAEPSLGFALVIAPYIIIPGIVWEIVGRTVWYFVSPRFAPTDLLYRVVGRGYRYSQKNQKAPWERVAPREFDSLGEPVDIPATRIPYFLNLADWFGWFIPFYPLWGSEPNINDRKIPESEGTLELGQPKKTWNSAYTTLTYEEIVEAFAFYIVRESDNSEWKMEVQPGYSGPTVEAKGPQPLPLKRREIRSSAARFEVRNASTGEIITSHKVVLFPFGEPQGDH